MLTSAKWIHPVENMGDGAPCFGKTFTLDQPVVKAELAITALGVYEAQLNGCRVGEFVLAPGWTVYRKRLQVQSYDVTALLKQHNELSVLVGKGWYRGRIPGWEVENDLQDQRTSPAGLIAELTVTFADGAQQVIATDETWTAVESGVRFSDIYDGEIVDGAFAPGKPEPVNCFDGPSHTLIAQEGEEIREQEHILPCALFRTPKGETVVDFGQNLTGYVAATVCAALGDVVDLSFAEVLDKDGNFYTDNYRSAKAQYRYLCREGEQTYKPHLTFWGFRYIRINEFPGGVENAKMENFTAIALHSRMERTGFLSCSNPLLNQLFDNVIWGQKGNFVDVPTDCPQRDERLGWTGDAQAFMQTACLNFNVKTFFTKWLNDMIADQHEDGYVGFVIPDVIRAKNPSAAWADAACICPWTLYQTYGDKALLESHFSLMCRWVDYIASATKDEYLWTGGEHFGDWLGLDAPSGSYKGSTREAFIASAFYAHSASLVVKAGRELGRDVSAYEALYQNIVSTFRKTFTEYTTQTECVLAAHFGLAEDVQAAADQLARMVEEAGVQLKTGFVGTPYLLHVLSSHGYEQLAYSLLLRTEYPSWLYPVLKGATTIWEHWDGVMEDGGFWSADMNSFNHYAYGAVADWVYGVAAGIRAAGPGFAKAVIAPVPDARLDWLRAEVNTAHGRIVSYWKKTAGGFRYDIETPVETEVVIGGVSRVVAPGSYCFYGK